MGKKRGRPKKEPEAPTETVQEPEVQKKPNDILRAELDRRPGKVVARGPSTPTMGQRKRHPEREQAQAEGDVAPYMPGPPIASQVMTKQTPERRRAIARRRKKKGVARKTHKPGTMLRRLG